MKNFRTDDNDELFTSASKKFLVDPSSWRDKAIDEAWLRNILPLINPFLAMDTFRGVRRIAEALSTDKTADGRALWLSYLDSYFRFVVAPVKRRELSIDDKKLEEVYDNDEITAETFEEFEDMINDIRMTYLGYERGFRNSFMWLWLFFKVLAKERAAQLQEELADYETPEIAILASIISYRVPENRQITHPLHIQVAGEDLAVNDIHIQFVINMYRALPTEARNRIYQVAGPVVDMMYYQQLMATVYVWPTPGLIAEILQYQTSGAKSYVEYVVGEAKNAHQMDPHVLVTPIEESVRILTETVPTNPEVGPGIYTGENCPF